MQVGSLTLRYAAASPVVLPLAPSFLPGVTYAS